mmetsp:Transcript_20911/g.30128  ORF Transcript_20911/g.30128 Transcript_20911/m.30128 type:complete len:119 (-) Transcript_20911:109-465(-)
MGDWACIELYHFGFDGFFPPTICNILKIEASQACGCRDAYPSPAPSESPQPTADIPVPTVPTIAPAPPTTEAPIFSAAAPQVPVEAPSNRAGPESKCNLSLSQGRGGRGGTGTAKGCD